MERVEFLMLRLLEQYRRKESPAELIAALGRIEQELLLSFTTEKKLETPMEDVEDFLDEEAIVSSSVEMLEDEPMPLFEIIEKGFQPEMQEKEAIVVEPIKETQESENQEVQILHLEINEKLSKTSIEIAQQLQETAINDLRKAIGINDKYLFINELFGGDEQFFEQTIKTLNLFNFWAEADFWIKKELIPLKKWDVEMPAVQQFMLLVKRRFA
jgi:hypothetical protein